MAEKKEKRNLHAKIIAVLEANPDGLDIHQIRGLLPADIGPQQHLDKRVRELRYKHHIFIEGNKYRYEGKRDKPLENQGIKAPLRAAVLNLAHGRCQMCGRTVTDDNIKLEVDHKVPHNWGGPTTLENLWAICGLCNGGKRDFFASFDDEEMRKVVAFESVHWRLAEILRLRQGEDVPSWFLEFVANVNDFQEDWQRRLRELRDLGIGYAFKKKRLATGKVESSYTLTKWADLPADPGSAVRAKNAKARQP